MTNRNSDTVGLEDQKYLQWSRDGASIRHFILRKGTEDIGFFRWDRSGDADVEIAGLPMSLALYEPLITHRIVLSDARSGRRLAAGIRVPLTPWWIASLGDSHYWWRKSRAVNGYAFRSKGERVLSLSFHTGRFTIGTVPPQDHLAVLMVLACAFGTYYRGMPPWWGLGRDIHFAQLFDR